MAVLLGSQVREDIFVAAHPDVISWTQEFSNQAKQMAIFKKMQTMHPNPCKEKALVVSLGWHTFSEFMPVFLCLAASKVHSNFKRHFIVQVAFEELGMRDYASIHADTFKSMCHSIGLSEDAWLKKEYVKSEISVLLSNLENLLREHTSDNYILGLLLGMEIPANENIEILFQSLNFNEKTEPLLINSEFFKIHRVNEDEHIRLNVANLLRFCPTEENKNESKLGVLHALNFWKSFWDCLAFHVEI